MCYCNLYIILIIEYHRQYRGLQFTSRPRQKQNKFGLYNFRLHGEHNAKGQYVFVNHKFIGCDINLFIY